jgi:protein involved in polysaccharide export with SLBB domain
MLEMQKQNSAAASTIMNENSKFPVTTSINAEKYFVGPNDVLSITVSPILPTENMFVISADMTVIIPEIGELDLRDKTLAEVKKYLSETIKRKVPNADVWVSLKQTRVCMVHVRGDVENQGMFSVPATYRVSDVIAMANKTNLQESSMQALSKKEMFKIRDRYIKDNDFNDNFVEKVYSERNISLIRENGKSQIVDIIKAQATGNVDYNPYVRAGDVINVPFLKESFPSVSINGEFLRSVQIVYKSGDRVSDVLQYVGGLTDEADVNEVYLLLPGNKNKIYLNIDEELNLSGTNPELLPGAVIYAAKKEFADSEYGSVIIKGEVSSPGVFLIEKGKTRIKDVIGQAGGFTEKAYLPLAYIMRKNGTATNGYDVELEKMKLFQYSDLMLLDTVRFTNDIMLRKPIVSCNLQKLFDNNDETQNVTLKDGDEIIIPQSPGQVYMFGQINSPGFIPFEENKTLAWYVERAGGYAQGADEERARVIRGKNNVWVQGEDDEIYILDGDKVYVPREPDFPPGTEFQKYGLIAGIIGSLGGLLSFIITVFRN